MTITKFERSFAGIKNKGNIKTVGEEKPTKSLVYVFKQAYPISMNSIPVSYENSDLLKCTVSFSYTRYYIKTDNLNQIDIEPKQPTVPGQPATAANYGTDFGSLA
jgi:hypothetical protein